MNPPHRPNLKAAVRALAVILALPLIVVGCRSPESETGAEMSAELREARSEMLRAMRAGGATPEQIR